MYKLLDDSRNEVKLKTEKLLKKLHFLLGQQVIDQCPSNKLQRVIDVVLNNNANSSGQGKAIAGGGTFGAAGAASLLVQASNGAKNSSKTEGKS